MFEDVTDHWTFQQDSDPKHTANKNIEFIEENVPNYISPTDWPPNSPDLNPIENIWGILCAKLEQKKYTSNQGFKKAIKKVWKELPQEVIQNCIRHMDDKLRKVIKAKGGHIKCQFTRR